MQLIPYFDSLSEAEQEAYAGRCGTTAKYLSTHIMYRPARKIPRRELMYALAEHSCGKVSFDDVLKHFYPKPEKKRVSA